MNKLLLLLLACCAVAMSYLAAASVCAQTEVPASAAEAFPILTRFELPRDYGYFLGDEIPLTLLIEAAPGVVLDLVNLPKKGERHGLFEVRNMHLSSSATANGQQVYRAHYTLQYFGATPLSVNFEPLEILYAMAQDRIAPSNTYHYKSLHTQPLMLNVSRIGPYHPTQAMDIKGPLADSRAGMIWGSVIVGVLLVLLSAGSWYWQWYHRRRRYVETVQALPSAAERTLTILRQEGAAFRPVVATPPPGAERLSNIIRQHLHEGMGISAASLTSPELASRLQGQRLGKELLQLLERCDAVKYQEPSYSQIEEWQLWWEAITLFEKLHEVRLS
jgi:hypothetical protein